MDWCTETPEGVVVSVRAKPRSSKSGIDGVEAGALKVRVRAAPVDGKANKEILETVAGCFGVAKSRVRFVSGETSKTKRLLVRGVSAKDASALVGESVGD